jgi:hypothetical protein
LQRAAWTSTDNGATWTERDSVSAKSWYPFVYWYGGYFWIQGYSTGSQDSTARRSTDGITWADSGIDLYPGSAGPGGKRVLYNSKMLSWSGGAAFNPGVGSVVLFDGDDRRRAVGVHAEHGCRRH